MAGSSGTLNLSINTETADLVVVGLLAIPNPSDQLTVVSGDSFGFQFFQSFAGLFVASSLTNENLTVSLALSSYSGVSEIYTGWAIADLEAA